MTWIKIEDQLPEMLPNKNYSRDVIFFADGQRFIGNYHINPAFASYPERTYWQENSTGCGYCAERLQATHWMEAPEVPK